MSYFASPEFFRFLLLGGVVSFHMTWRRLVNQIVPEPYLDEVFHVPQAQAYWAGRWQQWDPKITTPPGLYLFSYAVTSVRAFFNPKLKPTTEEWRFVNISLLYLLLVALYIWTALGKKTVRHENVLQREFSIILFPLLFFFSGLYYTDVLSTFTVVLTYIFWSASSSATGGLKVLYQLLHLLSGATALATRQTNIFWVSVFLGGLQVIETVKTEFGAKNVHDPVVSEAYFEDFPITSISMAQSAVTIIPKLVLALWPPLLLLLSFAIFVVWNGGVVLGDKDNHIATLHFPQMLYIWPFIVFFSWPVLLPQMSDWAILRRRLPRLATMVAITVLMMAAVHLNTIVHPFTLADNRHYTFYVFRILMRHGWIKYAAVPVYVGCAWLVINALGHVRDSRGPSADVVRVSFVLVWLLATSLSVITAPLVEPRYFIIPWLIWRLHVPECALPPEPEHTDAPGKATLPSPVFSDIPLLRSLAQDSSWLELAWYVAINIGTCYVFLYKGFLWPQEPGNIQRFMW